MAADGRKTYGSAIAGMLPGAIATLAGGWPAGMRKLRLFKPRGGKGVGKVPAQTCVFSETYLQCWEGTGSVRAAQRCCLRRRLLKSCCCAAVRSLLQLPTAQNKQESEEIILIWLKKGPKAVRTSPLQHHWTLIFLSVFPPSPPLPHSPSSSSSQPPGWIIPDPQGSAGASSVP